MRIQRYSMTSWEQEARAADRRKVAAWAIGLFLTLCLSAILADLLFFAVSP